MKYRFVVIFIALLSIQSLNAQEKGRPNIPGDFIVEHGFNILLNTSDPLNTRFFGSRGWNLSYLHHIDLGDRFSFNGGVGFAFNRYRLEDDTRLWYLNNDDGIADPGVYIDTVSTYNRSKFGVNYLDIPLELRFYFNPDDKNKGLRLTAGVKVGLRLGGVSKVRYDQSDETKNLILRESFNFTQFRYGAYGRIGFQGIALFYYHSLTELFEDTPVGSENASPIMAGISFFLF